MSARIAAIRSVPEVRSKVHPGRLRSAFVSARVLIADDNVDAAVALAEWLETMGYEVHTAFDGAEAFEMACRLHPDAVLLDISMPLLRGDEVCRRLRAEPWARSALIVAITGHSGAKERARSMAAGFDVYIVKPVDPREIRTLLQSL